MTTVKTIQDIRVMYVTAEGGAKGAKMAFDDLEGRLASLKGRKFLGVLRDNVYKACVELIDTDDPKALSLPADIIPGGRYAARKIVDWWQKLSEIGPTFESMAKEFERDESRPEIEFYRSQKELILMLPIK